MKIVLAVDESKFSEAAVAVVVQQMGVAETEVCLLHVVEPIWLALDYETGELREIEAARKEGMKRGRDLVARLEPTIRVAGFSASSAIEEGDPRFVIVDYAVSSKADLIVLGSHGRKGFSRLLIGSVAEHVARYAPCSVMVVRLPDAPRVIPGLNPGY